MSKEIPVLQGIDLPTWYLGSRPLTEDDKLNAKLADLSESDASRLTAEELAEEAETGWMIAKQDKTHLGS